MTCRFIVESVSFLYRKVDCMHTIDDVSNKSVAAGVREKVLASRDRFWRPADFNSYSSDAVVHALDRLVRRDELRHVRRGLYWRGTRTPLGMAPPPVSRLAKELSPGSGSGPAGLSAALELGLSTQVPRRTVIAVPTRAPAGTDTLRFVSRAASTGRKGLQRSEVALLEALRDWDRLVESPAAATGRIAGLVSSGDIRADRVAKASTREPARVRERLRGLLNDIGKPEAAATIPPARSRPLVAF